MPWVKADPDGDSLVSESSTEEPSWLQEGKVPLATAGSLAAPSGQRAHLEQTASHRKESPHSSLDFSVFTDGFSLPRGVLGDEK